MRGASRRVAFIAGLLAAAINLPSLFPGFIHDDHRIIEQNDLVHHLSRVPEILTHGYWSVGIASVPNLYRPATILSFALNHAIHGLHPLGFRLTNLGLHVVVTLMVLCLARRVVATSAFPGASAAAGLAAFLFAVHPVHTEVLGLVVGRAELLAAAGVLGCVLAFLRGREREIAGGPVSPWGWYAASMVALVVGFLSKENAVAAPFLALAADRLLVRRPLAWRFHAVSKGSLLLCLAWRAAIIGGLNPPGFTHFVDNPIAHLPFLEGRLTALSVIGKYALLLVAPLRMSIDYSYRAISPAVSFLEPGVLLGVLVLIVWAASLVVAFRRWPAAAFALAWIGLAMAPVANLILAIGTLMAERLLYLPSVGLCLLAGALMARLGDAFTGRAGGARAAAAIVLLAFSARTVTRLRDWRDDATIFRKALEVAPGSVRSLFNYGVELEQAGDDDAAIRAYREAIAIWPAFADAHYNLAGALARRKTWEEAVEHYREALREEPGNVPYLVNLGRALEAQGRGREAREVLERAVSIEPGSDKAYTNLGAACLALGDAAAAAAAYNHAARIDPANPDYARNLGLAQEAVGDLAAAAASYRRGLDLRPGDTDLLAALGIVLLNSGDPPGALQALQSAVRARPAQPMYRYNLGRALERNGHLAEAVTEYREAARLAPPAPVPQRALGLLLLRLGDRAGARDALERVRELDAQGTVMDEEARRALEDLRRAR